MNIPMARGAAVLETCRNAVGFAAARLYLAEALQSEP